ncbi:MAG: flagellar biosynthetic protein FliR [Deltaproteobacteria bacterium]|nr:flagellar biosynthetic protein FliR [Deltaproteobacteria bacterium]
MESILQELGIKANFSQVLLIWALLMSRVLPLILLAPFIGGEVVPSQVKLGVGIAFSLLLYPFVADTPIPPGSIAFLMLMLKEVFVGTTIALMASFAFDAARSAGTFVDTVSGANMATVFVPQIQQQATLYADFKFQLTIVIFLGLNGHHVVLQSLFTSFQVIPLNSWPKFAHGFWPLFQMVIRMTADMLIVAIALAAPATIATFITDLALGLINRVVPQIQVFFISMAIKPMLVAFITLSALVVLYERLLSIFQVMLRHVQHSIYLFS